MDHNITDVTVTCGDLVYVRHYSPVDGKSRGLKKARLVAFADYTGVAGGQHLGALVEYTSTTGEPYSHGRRERGEGEVVMFATVLPREMPEGNVRVHFEYDTTIPAYAHTGIVQTTRHFHPNSEV